MLRAYFWEYLFKDDNNPHSYIILILYMLYVNAEFLLIINGKNAINY
jgi:hypothetical protein